MNLLQHQVEVMRQHEILEDSRLGPKLMIEPSSQISMVTLTQTYAEQGRFKKQKKTQKTKKTKKDASRCLLRLPALKASLRLYT